MEELVICKKSDLVSIASAARGKAGTNNELKFPEGFTNTITNISVQLPSLSNPATASHIISSKEAINKDGEKITGTIPTQAAQTITPGTSDKTIASGRYLNGVQTIKGDANLKAENIKSGVSIFGVNGSLEASSGRDSDEILDDVIDRTITQISNDRVTIIGSAAFYNCSKLVSASFPNATQINGNAFVACSSLKNISFPKVTRINQYAFSYCTSLTSANFPECTLISNSAFLTCTKLTSISFPKCISINSCAFSGCTSLETVNFPLCQSLGSTAFSGCTKLSYAEFPVCISIYNSAFYGCTSLTNVSFPNCTKIFNNAFYNCSKLSTVTLPKCTNISGSAFRGCTRLSTLYLSASTVCTLAASTVFSSTGIGSNKGSIYVPASLLASYKAATNWTYFSNIIFSV